MALLGALTLASYPWESAATLAGRSPSYYMSLLLIAATVISVISRGGRFNVTLPPSVALGGVSFLTLALTSAVFSFAPESSAFSAALLGFLIVVTLCLTYAIGDSVGMTLRAYQASCILVAITGLLGVFRTSVFSPDEPEYREAAFGNFNDTAIYLAIGTLVALFFLLNSDETLRTRILSGLGMIPLIAAILSSGSRGSLLALLAGAMLVVIGLSLRSRYKLVPLTISAILAIVAIGLILGESQSGGAELRSFRFFDASGQVGDAGRAMIWQAALSSNPPLMGFGFGTSQQAMFNLTGAPYSIHNGYIATWMDLGWIGLSLAMMTLGALAAWSVRMEGRRPLFMGLWGIAIIGALVYPIELRRNLWVIIALALSQASLAVQTFRTSTGRRPHDQRASGEEEARRNGGHRRRTHPAPLRRGSLLLRQSSE